MGTFLAVSCCATPFTEKEILCDEVSMETIENCQGFPVIERVFESL